MKKIELHAALGLSFSSFRKLLRSVAGAPPARSPSYLSVSESCRA
jgi:hypothetical protein